MQRFRSTWLALMGGALLVTLSISAAFGAAPSGTADGTRGQTIAAFVHELVFGSEEQTDAELEQADTTLEDEAPDTDETDELAVESHGECVSEVARGDDASVESEESHGAVVSEAAQVTCWEDADEEDLTDPEEDEEAEEDVTEEVVEVDSHGACVSEVARDKSAIGGKNDNHGGAVSEAAHECGAEEVVEEEAAAVDEADADAAAAKEQRKADKAAAQAAKEAARADRKAESANRGNGANGNGNGNGKAKGHGKP